MSKNSNNSNNKNNKNNIIVDQDESIDDDSLEYEYGDTNYSDVHYHPKQFATQDEIEYSDIEYEDDDDNNSDINYDEDEEDANNLIGNMGRSAMKLVNNQSKSKTTPKKKTTASKSPTILSKRKRIIDDNNNNKDNDSDDNDNISDNDIEMESDEQVEEEDDDEDDDDDDDEDELGETQKNISFTQYESSYHDIDDEEEDIKMNPYLNYSHMSDDEDGVVNDIDGVLQDNGEDDNDNNKQLSGEGYDTSPLEEVDNEDENRSVFIQARNNLHISTIPEHLPGREKEKESISKFIRAKLINNDSGGCIYIAGIPGTGKTSTVKEVIRQFQEERANKKVIPFEFIELNGMEFSDPHHLYISLHRKMLKRPMKTKVSHHQALQLLQKSFTTRSKNRPFRIVLVDEFDLLITKKQSVIYNLFEWPNKPHSRLVIIAIANTMNLPDTLLPRVQSRMGLHRIPFSSYTANQIVKIVHSRLEGLEAFDQDAIQMCAMRVAAVCGDARRALDICRRATLQAEKEYHEILKNNPDYNQPGKVEAHHIEEVLDQFSTPITAIIRELTFYEKTFLYSFYKEQKSCGITDIPFGKIYQRMVFFCKIDLDRQDKR
ncbi:origin recognition complex subunit 1 [Heterostelium album PN500]|uniref:Origin recognition complex subunit 1 n=1 Tax=Heterostelium pallidum (strain ATCC 26659 / Pp 5 / PN500) TaxID=670386 RepID=D3BJB8_HETP5|nr:origin recognition complex subunit 1 [Heterostelium album PN500]EFA77998.1 origin recognition complex subunit 1 [Heterostelium album PN500]|eukprot:XP_020430126.1 origin recognition complex subunit 1 [Heterostelium album PN500]